CYRVYVCDTPKGISSKRRHEPDIWRHRGCAGNLFRGDGRAPASAGRHYQSGPECDEFHVEHRRKRTGRDRELGPHIHATQAAVPAEAERGPGDSGTQTEPGPDTRHTNLLAESPAYSHRGTVDKEPLSIHAAKSRFSRTV